MTYTKPRPNLDHEIEPFWKAVSRHEFRLLRCSVGGEWYFPFAYCRNHDVGPLGEKMEWVEASGRGHVFAFNIHHVAFDPEFRDVVPYVYALIELEEGPIFSTNVIGCTPGEVQIGAPVTIVFEDYDDDVTLPKARLVRDRS